MAEQMAQQTTNNTVPAAAQPPNNTSPAAAQPPNNTVPAAAQLPKITDWPGAWEIYKYSKAAIMRNINTFVVLYIALIILSSFSNFLRASNPNAVPYLIASLFINLSMIVISIATIVVYLAGVNNKKISVSESLKSISKYIVNYFIATFIVGLAAVASILLFIIPAFFVIPRLLFAPYLVIDKNMGGVDAVQASWNMSKGHVGKVYGIIYLTLAMILLSITIIGIPFSIYFVAMYSAAFAVLYNYVVNKK